jgi:type IV secretory pathway TraG/TraD family ATPase VirD4
MSSISKTETIGSVQENGLYIGRSSEGDVTSGPQRSALVLGPSRSGKTSSLIIPNLLLTTRPAIVTSTKDDVVRTMAHARGDGTVMLFDPSGTVTPPPGVRRVGYSPTRQSRQWDGAVLATRTLLDVQALARGNRGEDHWSERAGALIAPLLHASALREESLPQVISRIDARNATDSLDFLAERYGQYHPATSLLGGILATEERERSGIWSSASGLFAGLRTEAARQSSREAPLDIEKFMSAPHQLHVVAPSQHQAVSAPLVVGLIDEIVNATYDRHHNGARLLLALDELANVAPLPRLASIISEGGGQGVVTMACLQDLSQARARWGTAAEGFVSLFPTTVVLPGIADRPTLELLQQLAGRSYVATPSVQHGRRGQTIGHTISWGEHDNVSIAQLAQGREGYALALDSRKRVGWVSLTPSFRDPRFRPYLERSDRSRDRSRER